LVWKLLEEPSIGTGLSEKRKEKREKRKEKREERRVESEK
jgi:hypothetical protein